MLETNTSYINNGNYLSKSLIIKKSKNLDYALFVVASSKDLINYIKIFDFLNIPYQSIENQANLVDFLLNKSGFYIISSDIFNQNLETKEQFIYNTLELKVGESINHDELIKKLTKLNYSFSEYENPACYNKKGDILNIYTPDNKKQYIISFWGDIIEEITETLKIGEARKDTKNFKNIFLGKNDSIIETDKKSQNFIEKINSDSFLILDNLDFDIHYEDIVKTHKNLCSFDYIGNKNLKIKDLEISALEIKNSLKLKNILEKNIKEKKEIIIYTKNTKTINNFIDYNNLGEIKIIESKLNNIKSFEDKNKIIICDDILNQAFTKKRIKNKISSDLDLLLKIKPGDYVVHIDHGIGIFKEILKKDIGGIIKEYIQIEYLKNDKLFVPITEVGRVNKYVGIDNPKLTPLGGSIWEKKMSKAKQEASELAEELIELYAQRKLQKAFSFKPDFKKEKDFKDSFSYIHTIDQSQAIDDILEDMEKETPMDRLLIGDVGFGKTEIAFNTIYRAFLNKKQSIFIAPLVVLAYEHYEKAVDRFKNFGLKVGVLTRLENEKKEAEILKKLANGELDLIIGTHKLLNDKINFKNLGVIIIDEEHKFGVSDKEKIKQFKANIDSLAMSATPIPRSLNMALSKLREISILKTPPIGRQDVSTIINRYEENIIKEAGDLEFARGGQIFFVHNRVANIENYKTIIGKIFPDKKIVVAHGQMSGIELEKRIIAFKNKKYDILLSTTVIENGIDFPNVNTMIINDAPNFGLSQIHQLRGRVGRSDRKGYCYLLYKKDNLKDETIKRLKTIVQYSYVGAGFELAMKDLEIRGGGDLLGFRQSGQSSQIGVNLFLKLVEEKIEIIKSRQSNIQNNNETKVITPCKIDLNIDLNIGDDYFSSELDKLNFYREIENINSLDDLKELKQDFLETNGEINRGLSNLFILLEIKLHGEKYKIINIKKVGINYQIEFEKDIKIEELKKFLDLDKQVKFAVNSISRLRTSIKNFENENFFLKYLYNLFNKKIGTKKIKLKKKL